MDILKSHNKKTYFLMILVCLCRFKKIVNEFALNTPDMCFGPKNNRLHFGDGLDYDPDTGSGLRSISIDWCK